jgi:hypothetical protein
LTIALYKRIKLDILSAKSPFLPEDADADVWVSHSHSLTAVTDEIVASLYNIGDGTGLRKELSAFHTVIGSIRSTADSVLSEKLLVQGVEQLSVGGTSVTVSTDEKLKTLRKWLDVCYIQIENAVRHI